MQGTTNRDTRDQGVRTLTWYLWLFLTHLLGTSFQIDVDKAGKTAVISQASGRAYIIDINTVGDREPGQTLQQFSLRDVDRVVATGRHNYTFGAIYAASDNLVVYGSIGGRILVWDRETGRVKHQLDHEGGMCPFSCVTSLTLA